MKVTKQTREEINKMCEGAIMEEIDRYRTALERIRTFIRTLPMTVFGEGSNSDGMTWPIRDEFINYITLTLDREAMKGSFRGIEGLSK